MKAVCFGVLALVSCGATFQLEAADSPLRAQILALGEKDQAAMRAHDASSEAALKSHVVELKAIIKQHGWPTIAQVGTDGAQAAWLVAQHADFDLSFQLEALNAMEALAPKAQVNLADLAYLRDRVARAQGKPQMYGSQGECKNGVWQPFPIDKPESVDQRRQVASMKPIADYIAQATRMMCGTKGH